jgi:hypothetical protein
MTNHNQQIPAWAYGNKKVQAQYDGNFAEEGTEEPQQQEPDGPMMRYTFPFHITVDVPYTSDPEEEKRRVNAELDKIMQQLEGLYGDYVSHRPDTATRSMRGSLDSQDISLY